MSIKQKLMVLTLLAFVSVLSLSGFGSHRIYQVYDSASYCSRNSLPSVLVLDKIPVHLFLLQSLIGTHLVSCTPEEMAKLDQEILNLPMPKGRGF